MGGAGGCWCRGGQGCTPSPSPRALLPDACTFFLIHITFGSRIIIICIVPVCVIEDLKGDRGRFWPLMGFPLDKNNVFFYDHLFQVVLSLRKKDGPCYKTWWLGS